MLLCKHLPLICMVQKDLFFLSFDRRDKFSFPSQQLLQLASHLTRSHQMMFNVCMTAQYFLQSHCIFSINGNALRQCSELQRSGTDMEYGA